MYLCVFKTIAMNCHDFNADIIPLNEAVNSDILLQINEMEKCGKCLPCLYCYIMLAPSMSDEELTAMFGADLLDMPELIPELNELAGLVSNPYPNRLRITRVNKALQNITPKRSDKALIKHYINECIRQYEGDMIEEYFNMSP